MQTIIEKIQKLIKKKFKKIIFKIELCTYEQLKKIKIKKYLQRFEQLTGFLEHTPVLSQNCFPKQM